MVCKSRTKEYDVYLKMVSRCTDPRSHRWSSYGARGIKVCDRWLECFDNFIEDMGWRPVDKQSLDRIDNDGNYCKENCRWTTFKQQSRNKSNTIKYMYNGELIPLVEIAELTGYNYHRLYNRLRKGQTIEEALK